MFKVILASLVISYISIVSSFTLNNKNIIITQLNAKSRALPFLESPAKLDGTLIGDFGFDPLGFTDTLQTLNYVQAAELKHSRVSMLAVVGFIIQQKFHFLTSEADPFKAIAAVGYGPNLQILSFIGVIELATWDKTFKGETPGKEIIQFFRSTNKYSSSTLS
jgi:hypothetical protein